MVLPSTRRRLVYLSLALGFIALGSPWTALGCGGGDDGAAPDGDGDGPGPDTDEPPDPGDAGGVAPGIPSDDGGATIPSKIRYVMVLIKENHTFDNYFTGFPGAETTTTGKLSNGSTITRPTAPNGALARDMCHANTCGFDAYANGAMNGFDLGANADHQPFIHYTEQQIPNYWQYARNFVLFDHFFSTSLAPSTPGHSVFWAGRSLSLDNAACPTGGACGGAGCTAGKDVTITAIDDPDTCKTTKRAPCFDVPSIADHLPAGFSWIDYGSSVGMMIKSNVAGPNYKDHFRSSSYLIGDLGSGHLANLTIAHLTGSPTSEHPPQAVCPGENQTVQIINAAMKLPQWKEMAILVTWDDWGGFYDHVAPTVKKCANGKIFNTGFRLPMILISPYAKKGFVDTTHTEQASVPKLVEDLWGMTYMSTRDPRVRDGAAGSMMDAFDFTQEPRDPMPLTPRTCP
jgi:phospholipase C